jgi:hypothetical protein
MEQQHLEAEEAEAMANQQYDDDMEQQRLEAKEAEAMANQQFYNDMEQQHHLEVEEDDQWDGEDNEDDMG